MLQRTTACVRIQGISEQQMAVTTAMIKVSGLGKDKLAALREQAKNLGMSAEGYARRLIEEGLSLDRLAQTMTFDELFAPAQARFRKSGMSEDDLDKLVDRARSQRRRAFHKKG